MLHVIVVCRQVSFMNALLHKGHPTKRFQSFFAYILDFLNLFQDILKLVAWVVLRNSKQNDDFRTSEP